MRRLAKIITLAVIVVIGSMAAAQTREDALFTGRAGDAWLSSTSIRGADGTVRAAPRSPLPNATLTPVTSDPFGNVWGFAKVGEKTHVAAVLSPQPDEWKIYGEEEGVAPGAWNLVTVDNIGFVWVGGQDAIVRYDSRKPKEGWVKFPADKLPNARVTALGLSFRGLALAGFADGSLIEVDMHADGTVIANTLAAEGLPEGPINAIETGSEGEIILTIENIVHKIAPPEGAWQHNWTELARMPVGNHDIYGALLDGKMFVAAGLAIYGYPPAMAALPELWAFEPAANRWQIVSAVPTSRWYCGIAALNGEIWVLGGFYREDGKRLSTDAVEIYNPAQNSWRRGPKLDVPRAELIALTAGDRIYVVGGVNDKPDGKTDNVNTIISIGSGETEWREEAPTPNVVRQASGCVLDGRIYIAGGQAMRSPGLQVYDVEKREWVADIPPYPGKPANTPLSAAYKGEIWLMGGSGIDDSLRVSRYLPETNEWKSGPELPSRTGWAAACEIGGRLYIAGGGDHSREHRHWYFSDRTFMLRD